ncbi:UPF0158 family protein [Pseudomonas sp. NCHU5208]|uniref:UPF0158 family protein n=1 Tax=unclassified Pseudomonas TaxID=196821 RepID=UPI003F98C4C4
MQTEAFICLATGKTYFRGDDDEWDELPEDIEDDSKYLLVPGKHDLDLGLALVMRFTYSNAPHLEERIHDIFRRKGAYSRFKELLLANDLLDSWYEYENQATREALEEWASENGIIVRHDD